MNPFDSSLFTAPSCLPCCTPAPADCPCALLIPPFEPWPYADYATAEGAIADQTDSCISYFVLGGDGGAGNTFASSFDGTTYAATQDAAFSGGAPGITNENTISVSMLAGDTLSIAFTVSTDGGSVYVSCGLQNCATGDVLDSDSSTSTSGTMSLTAPADGEYVVSMQANA